MGVTGAGSAPDQGICSASPAFAVAGAVGACLAKAEGLERSGARSAQQLLDCGGGAGCDGSRSSELLDWAQAGDRLYPAPGYPYTDGFMRYEGQEGRECYAAPGPATLPTAVLDTVMHSWHNHTERDLENLILAGHAIITTMAVSDKSLTKLFQHLVWAAGAPGAALVQVGRVQQPGLPGLGAGWGQGAVLERPRHRPTAAGRAAGGAGGGQRDRR